jgi:hypothetical protein
MKSVMQLYQLMSAENIVQPYVLSFFETVRDVYFLEEIAFSFNYKMI